MNLKSLKGSVSALSGLVVLLLTVVAVIAYFTDSVSVSSFASLAFIASAIVLVLAFFRWLTARAAGLFVATVVVLLVGVMYGAQPAAKSNLYQAVFLTNGQVYFGHLHDPESKTPTLTDVYYLQSNPSNPQNASSDNKDQNQLSLVKLGNELHGPEDEMVLKGDQILFWENLKKDGKVAEAIKQNQTKK